MSENEYNLKLIVLGNSDTNKKSFVFRFNNNVFKNKLFPANSSVRKLH